MSVGTAVYRFGPFDLDPERRRLFLGSDSVTLSAPQMAVLLALVSRPGEAVTKDALIEAGWGGAAPTENALEKAVSLIRETLEVLSQRGPYIETVRGVGYRFVAPVELVDRHDDDPAMAGRLARFEAFVDARDALATLDPVAIHNARKMLITIVRDEPDYGPAHTAMAMACGHEYEGSITDAKPKIELLDIGVTHGRIGTEREPTSGEAWSALAYVLYLRGEHRAAIAAAYMAESVQPGQWRHALRTGYVTWGDERLAAAGRALAARPRLALACWQRTSVYIGRGALDVASVEAREGCAAQDPQKPDSAYRAVGMHLLHGLILAERDCLDEAIAELKREIAAAEGGRQIYARECAANSWYALGAILLRQRRRDEGIAPLKRSLAIFPRHASANALLHGTVPPQLTPMDAAVGEAIVLARGNRHADGARVYREAVAAAPPGCAGWLLAVEPALHPSAHPEAWAETLELLRVRAS